MSPCIAIAGASGYIGRALIQALLPEYRVIALSRTPVAEVPGLVWRFCDLYSLLQAEHGLQGADYAVYLVHSMLPSAHLSQGHFADMDLILADNFARACRQAGVQQILYLGGIIPPGKDLSPHLRSRWEVEQTLASHGIPVTTLRASLIIGPRGSSFQIVESLVRRLPILLCPAWTQSLTQPIALRDVIQLLCHCLNHPDCLNQSYDIAGPDIVSYQQLMQLTAEVLGLKRLIITLPWLSPRLSCQWVSLITQVPHELVNPLVESLKHPMIAGDLRLQQRLNMPGLPLRQALEEALRPAPLSPKRPVVPKYTHPLPVKKALADPHARVVRSVQRLPLPSGRTALWVAEKYTLWLPRLLYPLILVEVDDQRTITFYLRGVPIPLLILRFAPERSTLQRTLFYIEGGLLADHNSPLRGRLEFREVLGGKAVLAAIHDFSPRLPWYLYQWTQARLHLWVMHRFRRYLQQWDVL